jgi:hypothetical protein
MDVCFGYDIYGFRCARKASVAAWGNKLKKRGLIQQEKTDKRGRKSLGVFPLIFQLPSR